MFGEPRPAHSLNDEIHAMRRRRQEAQSDDNDYWPGYVDALVNIVINLVFLSGLMVVVFAVQNSLLLPIKRQSQELLEDPAMLIVQGMEALARQYDALGLDKEHLFKNLEAGRDRSLELSVSGIKPLVIQVAGNSVQDGAKTSSVDVRIREQNGHAKLVIRFGASGFELSSEHIKTLQAQFAGHAQKLRPPLVVQATVPENNPDAQRIAFLRILAVRNQLIAGGASPETIQTHIKVATDPSSRDVQEITVSSSAP